MSEDRPLYVEEKIIGALKRLLAGRVNEILEEAQFVIPLIEYGNDDTHYPMSPLITLITC